MKGRHEIFASHVLRQFHLSGGMHKLEARINDRDRKVVG